MGITTRLLLLKQSILNNWRRRYKSGQRDFLQSVQEPRAVDAHYRRLSKHGINPFEESTEHVNFMSSVEVVPKTSGPGYDVYKSAPSTHQDNSTSDYLNGGNIRTTEASPKLRIPEEGNSGTSTGDDQLNPSRSPHSKGIASKGTKFSMNIANPTMQKKTQDKMQQAKNRADMFLSTRVESLNNPLIVDNDRELRSTPVTPTLIRKSKVRSSPGASDLKDLTDIAKPARSETPPRPASTSGSPRSSPNKTYVNKVPTSSSQLGPTDIPASFTHDEVCSFHESLFNNLQNDRQVIKTTSPVSDFESNGSIARNEYFTRSVSLAKSEASRKSMRTIINILRKKISSKQFETNKSQKPARTSNNSKRSSTSFSVHEFECSCKRYHCHSFSGEVINHDLETRKEKRQGLIMNSMNLQEEQEAKNVQDASHIFWIPSLSFHAYKRGDRKVKFASLWPKYKELKELLQNTGLEQTVLSPDALLDICTLACTCGPVHLLQCLLELKLIRIDQVLEGGSGLLHLAILAHNIESAQFLMAAKISPKFRDIKGLTADQVCFNPSVRKQMAPRYLLNRDVSRDKIMLKPSLQDKDFIFKLAASPRHFVEIQKKLQTLDFNVNTECDNNGDFLLHIVVREGLNQLPLLMALVNIQKADVELCNADGMTSLMIAAAAGNCVLCDVLVCLFGADPNKRSPQSGRSALHYAAESNHRKTVECLIRRGADINMEDHDGLRADDVPACLTVTDDCRELIMFNRSKRLEMLSDLVKKGEVVSSQLLPSDLCVVDEDGNTLIMLAASYNRFQTLHCLLAISKSTMNAQHSKTGMTALALAAKMGHAEATTVLLRHKAVSTIADMVGYLPLHHAVMNNHENVVDVILDFYPDTFVGLYKAMRFCKRTSLHTKLRSAWERRQEEIVTPKLLGCALNGNAEDLFLLLDEGDNINPKSGTGNWPLYLAVENGHLEVLKLLCEKGGDIHKRHPTTGATSLHVAAKMGHQSIVSFLLQYCSNRTKSLPTSAQQMNISGAPSAVQQNLGHRKKLLDINATDKDNKTALQLAAEKGFSRIVDLLLSKGATTALLDREGNLVTCPQFEGVRIMIENCRQQHVHQLVKVIEEKSKKAPPMLPTIWLPKFDHNLRNKEGSTPLMVAAATGKVQVIQFLLESAVYPEETQFKSDSADSDSDTDSGVLVPVAGSPKDVSKMEDEFQASVERESEQYTLNPDVVHESKQQFASSLQDNGSDLADSSEFYQKRLSRIVNEANRPKGLSIFHDGMISHVCAMNLNDGTNVLHHSIRNSDAPHILSLFLDVDPTPLNMQDDQGETVLHLACRLKRKKSVEFLLARPDLDLNIRTFDGCLPEEVTSSKAIKKVIEKARALSAQVPVHDAQQQLQHEASICGSEKTSSIGTSTVNFDRVHSRYEKLKNLTKRV